MKAPERIKAIDWSQVGNRLDAQGSAVIKKLVSADECVALAALYPSEGLFRSRVVMARHSFGRGEYKYFDYPLPSPIARFRTALYPPLALIANRRATPWCSRSTAVRFKGRAAPTG